MATNNKLQQTATNCNKPEGRRSVPCLPKSQGFTGAELGCGHLVAKPLGQGEVLSLEALEHHRMKEMKDVQMMYTSTC